MTLRLRQKFSRDSNSDKGQIIYLVQTIQQYNARWHLYIYYCYLFNSFSQYRTLMRLAISFPFFIPSQFNSQITIYYSFFFVSSLNENALQKFIWVCDWFDYPIFILDCVIVVVEWFLSQVSLRVYARHYSNYVKIKELFYLWMSITCEKSNINIQWSVIHVSYIFTDRILQRLW